MRGCCRAQAKGEAGFNKADVNADRKRWLEISFDGGAYGTCCWIVRGR